MHDLARTQELDDVVDVGIVGKAQDVIVGHARLLLGGEVLGRLCILDYKINYSFPFEL